MTAHQRLRYALVAAFIVLAGVLGAATWLFVSNAGKHIGADYTAFASNLVRGQHETTQLRYTTEALLDNPRPLHQERLRRILQVVQSREQTTRHGLAQRELDSGDYQAVVAEFERVHELLPRLQALTREALDNPDIHDELRELSMEVEDTLAFIYSELHELNHAAAGQQRRLTGWLSSTVIGLGVLLLSLIGALLWAIDKVIGQRARLEQLTVTDALTGLPNRRAIVQRTELALTRSRRSGNPVSLALLDIDDFKTVNDRDGHPAGDAVLRLLAGHLHGLVRETDVFARIGGEEFGLLMPDTDEQGARELCERIRLTTRQLPLPVAPGVAGVTISIGLTTGRPDQAPGFDTLYIKADQALYEAKRTGRNRVVVQDQEPVNAPAPDAEFRPAP